MKQLKVYRKIHERNKILGLEFPDLLLLVLIYLGVFLFSKNLLLNLLVVGIAYFFLRLYKKGKPSHWTASVFRFLFKTRYYGQKREHPKELDHEEH
ncbi:MAG: hypothetical protein V1882_04955 [Candidatus Omnitrophota bacterium]